VTETLVWLVLEYCPGRTTRITRRDGGGFGSDGLQVMSCTIISSSMANCLSKRSKRPSLSSWVPSVTSTKCRASTGT